MLALEIAVIGLVSVFVLPNLARGVQAFVVYWAALALGGTLGTSAIVLARRAVRRIDSTSDKRGLLTAQWGLIVGWIATGYVGFLFLTSIYGLMFGTAAGVVNNLQSVQH